MAEGIWADYPVILSAMGFAPIALIHAEATVRVAGIMQTLTDGNGYYLLTDLPA